MNLKHCSFSEELSGSSLVSKATFQGTQHEMANLMGLGQDGIVSVTIAGVQITGTIKSKRMYQEAGPFWNCDISWVPTASGEVRNDKKPLEEYGKKSCQLEGGLLSVPLENHPDYRTNWNHFLASDDPEATLPSWWEDETSENCDDDSFRWVKSRSELPFGIDSQGKKWRILADPQMKGVTNYDVGTYVIRESVKCTSAKAAGNFVRGKLNKIVRPSEDFGITAAEGGDWKCDSAHVSWESKDWVAHLTYTKSGDDQGWNKRLYKRGS